MASLGRVWPALLHCPYRKPDGMFSCRHQPLTVGADAVARWPGFRRGLTARGFHGRLVFRSSAFSPIPRWGHLPVGSSCATLGFPSGARAYVLSWIVFFSSSRSIRFYQPPVDNHSYVETRAVAVTGVTPAHTMPRLIYGYKKNPRNQSFLRIFLNYKNNSITSYIRGLAVYEAKTHCTVPNICFFKLFVKQKK